MNRNANREFAERFPEPSLFFSHEQKTAAGSAHGFIFMLILAVVCLIFQIVGLKKYEKTEEQ